MTPELLAALAAFAFVSSVTPGPNNLMLMASGTNFGFVRTLPHMLGVSIGFTAMIVLVGLGLAQLFAAYPVAHDVLRAVSVAYLLWLAWKLANAAPPSAEGPMRAKPMTFVQAALFQWVNPKAWTMALTAVTAYLPANDALMSLIIVALVFGAINLPTVGSWTLMGVQLRRFLSDPLKLRVFNTIAALALVGSLYPIVFGAHA
jgi:threonine/homoserine/homoserine lactone efflux protein